MSDTPDEAASDPLSSSEVEFVEDGSAAVAGLQPMTQEVGPRMRPPPPAIVVAAQFHLQTCLASQILQH